MSIPATKNNLPSMGCVSAMQKCIRRGMEREAMEFAVELMHTSKAFHTMVCNRLEVIAHEDIDSVAAPWIVPYVAAAVAQSKARYDRSPENPGEARMMVGNVIRLLCRAPKSREDATSPPASASARCWKATHRPCPTGPTISTPSQARPKDAASNTSAPNQQS